MANKMLVYLSALALKVTNYGGANVTVNECDTTGSAGTGHTFRAQGIHRGGIELPISSDHSKNLQEGEICGYGPTYSTGFG